MKYPFVISRRQNQIYLDTNVLWYHRKDISCTTTIASDNNIEQLYPNRTSDSYIAFLMELTDEMGKV